MAFLWFIKHNIIYRDDKIAAAKVWVPVLLALMTGSFMAFLASKTAGRILPLSLGQCLLAGLGFGVLSYVWFKWRVGQHAEHLENRNASLKILFRMPLIFAAGLLSFAHGANDVSSAIGPLAAIVQAAGLQPAHHHAPLWVLLIGAFGISAGIVLFGPRLIRVVGEQIARLNPVRAFCVSLSAAITVLVASGLGLPVSSTHIAVGAVFGAGLFREWYGDHSTHRKLYVENRARQIPDGQPEPMPVHPYQKRGPIDDYEDIDGADSRYRYLVRRSHFMSIMAAWIVTATASGILAAIIASVFILVEF